MCLAQGPQRSDAGEAQTRGLSVSSQALYHWATALPQKKKLFLKAHEILLLITYASSEIETMLLHKRVPN